MSDFYIGKKWKVMKWWRALKFVKKDCYKGQLISAFSFAPSINMHIIFWILYSNISDYSCVNIL